MTTKKEMTRHATRDEVQSFCVRSGGALAMTRVAEHISHCPPCREVFGEVRAGLRGNSGMVVSLDADSWLRAEHLEYEQKKAFADGVIGIEEREISERHLAICDQCSEDLAAFLEDRCEIEPMLSMRYAPSEATAGEMRQSFWRVGGLWSPVRAAALILMTLGLATLGAFGGRAAWNRLTPLAWLEQPSQQPVPSASVAEIQPEATRDVGTGPNGAGPKSSGGEGVDRLALASAPRMTLSDHGKQLVVERRVLGVTGASDAELETITEALLAEDIPIPAVITDLWGAEGALRGERLTAFELMRPRREVVRDSRPLFRWGGLKDAVSYQVFVTDSRHAIVVSSGRLPGRVTEWRPPAPLNRGAGYSWTVSANVRGEEVISPTPAEAEWKFRVMADAELSRLRRLELRTQSHLARGIFYARAGLVTDAESELRKLLTENEGSTAVQKLLERVASWR